MRREGPITLGDECPIVRVPYVYVRGASVVGEGHQWCGRSVERTGWSVDHEGGASVRTLGGASMMQMERPCNGGRSMDGASMMQMERSCNRGRSVRSVEQWMERSTVSGASV